MKTRTGRLWVYVRDDRPFGGQDPPAALYDDSPTRHGERPRRVLAAWSGVIQADAYSGDNALYTAERKPAPVVEAACRSHGRRDFFPLAKLGTSPICAEVVRRIDEVFALEREINDASGDTRLASGRCARGRSSPISKLTCASRCADGRRTTTSPRRSATC
jgi:transposase